MSNEVILPKKSSRSNLRKRTLPNEDNEDEDDNIVVNSSEFLSLVREEQKLRVKKNGIVVDTSGAANNLAHAADANVKSKPKSSKKSIESTMKNQFSSQSTSTDNYGSVSHDKILDEYIADKLGLKDDTK
jgi:hypothetical protein